MLFNSILTQTDPGLPVRLPPVLLGSVFGLLFFVLLVAGLWKTFTKAGKPGWHALIPILNWYTMTKIAGRPGWWVILLFVPILNFVIWLMLCLDFAYAFGKTSIYGILIFFFPWVMFLILGFGDTTFSGARPV